MKLLLTSGGITNKSIAQAVLELTELKPEEINFVFIPTAANTVEGDKDWLIENLKQFQDQGYGSIDIVDIAAVPKEIWLPRFEQAHVLCFGGGNEQYLAKIMRNSGLVDILPKLLETRLYIGLSAGSMVTGKFITHEQLKIVYPEEFFDELAPPLEYLNLSFISHLNSEYFIHVRKDILEKLKPELKAPLYALDDNSALKVVDGNVEVIGEGEYLKI